MKIQFIWSGVTTNGTISSIKDNPGYKTVKIKPVDNPVNEFTFILSDLRVGQHGPITILSLSK